MLAPPAYLAPEADQGRRIVCTFPLLRAELTLHLALPAQNHLNNGGHLMDHPLHCIRHRRKDFWGRSQTKG